MEGQGELIISNLDFAQALSCTLTFQIADQDLGIKYSADNNNFFGKFSRNTYLNMIDIMDRLGEGYNWLYDPSDEDQIDLLISSGGRW